MKPILGDRAHRVFIAMAFPIACAWAIHDGRIVDAAQEERASSVKRATLAYECDDGAEFVAHYDPNSATDGMTVFLPDRTVHLPHVRSGSGTKYSDGTITYWSKGNEALLEIGDGTTKKCREIRRRSIIEDAKLRGVEFYGRGNEPGWKLEVSPDEIVFQTNYGQDTYRFPSTEPKIDQGNGRTVYRMQSEGHELTVEIRGVSCADDMSGEAFESTVVITLDGRTHRGCGHSLR